jgi:FHA domain
MRLVSIFSSRRHASIYFDERKRVWLLRCYSRNGVYVDGIYANERHAPLLLTSRSLIQIGAIVFYFLLPRANEAYRASGPPPSAETQALDKNAADSTGMSAPKSGTIRCAWPATSRRLFRLAIIRYGFGQWDKIVDALRGKGKRTHTVDDVAAYALHFVVALHRTVGDRVRGLDPLVRRARAAGVSTASLHPSTTSWDALSRASVSWSHRLVYMYQLDRLLNKVPEEKLIECIGSLRAAPPIPYWGGSDDRDLLLGTHKHGYLAVDDWLKDDTLSFRAKLEHHKKIFAARQLLKSHNDDVKAAVAAGSGSDAVPTVDEKLLEEALLPQHEWMDKCGKFVWLSLFTLLVLMYLYFDKKNTHQLTLTLTH